jgi:putative membrane protein
MSEIDEFRNREADLVLAKKLKSLVWGVTLLVFLLVGMMRRVTIPLPEGVSLDMLPPLHASLNAAAAMALVLALVAIKRKRVKLHRRLIHTAMVLSGLFLLSYVTYHFTSGETIYGDANHDGTLDDAERTLAGGMRVVYLVVLISHIVLAALSLPFILMTWVYGITAQFGHHQRMARRVFPVWLYVAVTGPACYLLLRPFY